ncbi:MAG TPA: response regulator [Polyangiaceae bacterium]|nr:response regulator [Polyangiaceae bacterium]
MTTTLLAIDDSKTMRKVLEITFASQDFRLILCGSGDDAVSKLSERPAVALVDAGLEGTSGYDVCRNLKASAPGLSVIILSNKQQPYDRNRGAQVGADDFMDKPFDTQQLIDKVTALAKKQGGVAAPTAAAVGAAPGRAPTLSYGQNPVAGGIGAPPVPVPAPPVPFASSRQTAPGMSGSASPAATPIASVSRAPTLLGAQLPPEVTPKPVPAPSAAPSLGAAQPAVATAMSGNGVDFAQKLGSLGLTPQQVEGVLSLSREVVERIVWEVVPTLAETLIREEIQRLTKE